jgi:hypothetical protein
MNLSCPGSDRVERSSQPRLIALSIVPNYLKEQYYPDALRRPTEYPANGSFLSPLLLPERLAPFHCEKRLSSFARE